MSSTSRTTSCWTAGSPSSASACCPARPPTTSCAPQREARLAAGTNHPHVVSIFDLVKDEDCYWLVMEHVDGRTLAELVTDRRAAAGPTCSGDPRPGRRRARAGRHRRGRAPRRQAQQHHPRRRRRPRQARRLRHRAGRERHRAHPDRPDHRVPRLPRARGGDRGACDRGERRVVARRRRCSTRSSARRRTTSGTTCSAASTRSSTTTRPGCPTTTPRRAAGRDDRQGAGAALAGRRRCVTTCDGSHGASRQTAPAPTGRDDPGHGRDDRRASPPPPPQERRRHDHDDVRAVRGRREAPPAGRASDAAPDPEPPEPGRGTDHPRTVARPPLGGGPALALVLVAGVGAWLLWPRDEESTTPAEHA